MYDYKIVEQITRTPKPLTNVLRIIMIVFAVIFLLLGIIISRGFMLSGFLFVVLYYVYDIYSQKEYEYTLEGHYFTIDIILGKRHRKSAHVLDMDTLEILAPNWHNSVARYRKNGDIMLRKYDYTSYEEDIPFYTMIIMENQEKIKLLLDLNDNILQMIKKQYPDRVYLS